MKSEKMKPRACEGCMYEWNDEPVECTDCFDYTKGDGFDSIRKNYEEAK